MDWQPLLDASAPIPVHAVAAMTALVLGAVQLAMPKGTARHRIMGYVWLSLMALTALTSFAIFDLRLIGPFSPIHLLSLFVLLTIFHVVRDARRGNIRAHARAVKQLYGLGLVLTGAFTLLPGRVMHAVVFGG